MKHFAATLFCLAAFIAMPASAQDAPKDGTLEAAHATHGYKSDAEKKKRFAAPQGVKAEKTADEELYSDDVLESDQAVVLGRSEAAMLAPTTPVLDYPLLSENKAVLAAIEAGGEPIVFRALGVECSVCAAVLTKRLSKLRQSAAVHVDYHSQAVSVVLKPGKSLPDLHIERATRKAGYKAVQIWRPEIVPQG